MSDSALLVRIAALEKENLDYLTELHNVWREIDRYRTGLQPLLDYPDAAVTGQVKKLLGTL